MHTVMELTSGFLQLWPKENAAFSGSCDPPNAIRVAGVAEDALRMQLVHSVHYQEEAVAFKGGPHELDASYMLELSSGRFKCTYCSMVFVQRHHVMHHMCAHMDESPFQCHLCPMEFKAQDNLGQHLRIHKADRPFQCQVCQEGFKKKCNLTEHITIHKRERPFRCHLCSKGFKMKRLLTDHLHIHTHDRPFQCHACQKGFTQQATLKNHLWCHAAENGAFSECSDPLSATGATRVAEDSTHLCSVHDQVKAVAIKEEPYDSTASTGSEPSHGCFKCTFCSKAFPTQHRLVYHVHVHTGDKPFHCLLCPSAFTQKGHLKQHLLAHTGNKPFHCHVCHATSPFQET